MMNKKLLLICYQNLKPGGVARALTNLANELYKEKYDVSIHFLVKDKNDFYEILPGVKIIELDSFGTNIFKMISPILEKYFSNYSRKTNLQSYVYDFAQWYVLRNWLVKNQKNYDTIISSWYKISSQISLSKKTAKKTIAWENANYNVGGKFWRNWLRSKYKNLKSVVFANMSSENYYRNINFNSKLIPYIVGEPFESFDKIDFKAKKKQLLYVGRLDLEKNVQSIINIIQHIDMKDFVLKIIGDGPELSNLENLVWEKGLASKIIFTGKLSIDEIKKEQKLSKVFLFTSLTESFGMVLLESVFSGNAVIAYDCDFGPSDIINDNNGFLIPINNEEFFAKKLQFLIDNPIVLDKLNKTSFEESKKWKKELAIEKWKEIINS